MAETSFDLIVVGGGVIGVECRLRERKHGAGFHEERRAAERRGHIEAAGAGEFLTRHPVAGAV